MNCRLKKITKELSCNYQPRGYFSFSTISLFAIAYFFPHFIFTRHFVCIGPPFALPNLTVMDHLSADWLLAGNWFLLITFFVVAFLRVFTFALSTTVACSSSVEATSIWASSLSQDKTPSPTNSSIRKYFLGFTFFIIEIFGFNRFTTIIPKRSWKTPQIRKHFCQWQRKKESQKDTTRLWKNECFYPLRASAPPTISRISLVMAAWRALL